MINYFCVVYKVNLTIFFCRTLFWGVLKLSFCLGLELIFFCIVAIFLSV